MNHLLKAVTLILCVCICQSAYPQIEQTVSNVEFGSIDELRGKYKVYVYCGNFQIRDKIIKEINKYERLQVVGRYGEAEFILSFGAQGINTGANISGGLFGATITNNTALIGDMIAYLPHEQGTPMRVVWSTRKIQSYSGWLTLNRATQTNATRQFLKELKAVQTGYHATAAPIKKPSLPVRTEAETVRTAAVEPIKPKAVEAAKPKIEAAPTNKNAVPSVQRGYVKCEEGMAATVPFSTSPRYRKSLKCGEKLRIMGQDGPWTRVHAEEDGVEGNVSSRFVGEAGP